jgi:hypothetical protein
MKILYVNEPVDAFRIPPLAPTPVAEAEANFQRLAGEYAEVKGQIAETLELRKHEIGQAHAAASRARIDGTKPPAKTADKLEAEYDTKLAALRAEEGVLKDAVDQAGDTLLESIAEHRAEWLESLLDVDRKATARLSTALDEVDLCLAEIGHTRAAPRWLRAFRVSSDQTQYAGGSKAGQTNNLRSIVKPPRELKCYRNQVPIYRRFAPDKGRVVFEYADGRPVEPEVAKEIR